MARVYFYIPAFLMGYQRSSMEHFVILSATPVILS